VATHSHPKKIAAKTGPSRKLECSWTHKSCAAIGSTKNERPRRSYDCSRNATNHESNAYSKSCPRSVRRVCATNTPSTTSGDEIAHDAPTIRSERSVRATIAPTRKRRRAVSAAIPPALKSTK